MCIIFLKMNFFSRILEYFFHDATLTNKRFNFMISTILLKYKMRFLVEKLQKQFLLRRTFFTLLLVIFYLDLGVELLPAKAEEFKLNWTLGCFCWSTSNKRFAEEVGSCVMLTARVQPYPRISPGSRQHGMLQLLHSE